MPNHRHVAASRGLTRFEIALILGFLGLVGGGIGLYASSASASTDQKTADSNARRIAAAADAWREHNGELGCPTVSRLMEDGNLERAAPSDDPWGGRYRIECNDSATKVRSAGRDKRLRTDDDVTAER